MLELHLKVNKNKNKKIKHKKVTDKNAFLLQQNQKKANKSDSTKVMDWSYGKASVNSTG